MDIAGLTLSIVGASVFVADVRKGFRKVLATIAHWHNYPKDLEKFKGSIAAAHRTFERWEKSIEFVYRDKRDADRSIAAAAETILLKIREELNKATRILDQHSCGPLASAAKHSSDLEAGPAASSVHHSGSHVPNHAGTRTTWTFAQRGEMQDLALAIEAQIQELNRLSPEAYDYSRDVLIPEEAKARLRASEKAQADAAERSRRLDRLVEPTAAPGPGLESDMDDCYAAATGHSYTGMRAGNDSNNLNGNHVAEGYRGPMDGGPGNVYVNGSAGDGSTNLNGNAFGGRSIFEPARERRSQGQQP